MKAILMALIKTNWRQIAGGAVAVAVMVCIVVAWNIYSVSCYNAGQAAANQEWKKKWADRDTADAMATVRRERAARDEEQRRQQAADAERKRADEELAKVQADAAAARRAGDGLQQQLVELQRQFAGSETGRLSAITEASAAKAETSRVLAELLSESDKRAGVYAKEADERYEAGSSCERTYDEVTKQRE